MREHKFRGIRFVWNLHFRCNYRCHYCLFDGKWEELSKDNLYLSVEEWMKVWGRIYERYGSVEILFIGGEPFLYPSFVELCEELSKQHFLGLTTNLSIDIENFAEKVKPERVIFGIGASFHPLFAKFDVFLKKVLCLKDKGFKVWVCYIAYPPQMKQMEYYKKKFEQEGIDFLIQPFRGEYESISYPAGYTDNEKALINSLVGNSPEVLRDMEYQLYCKNTKGKLCRAGQMLAHIQADGRVKRCGKPKSSIIGDILDENLELQKSPLPCEHETCPCDHVYLVEDNEKILNMKIGEETGPKISLVLAPVWGIESPPYVLALLAGILRNRNNQVSIFDVNNYLYQLCDAKDKKLWNWEESTFWSNPDAVANFVSQHNALIEDIVNKILLTDSDIIAFSAYSSTRLMSLEIARRIKQKDRFKIIIFGGTECQTRLNWKELIDKDYIDATVLNEADESFAEFIDLFRRNGEFQKCPGIIYKKEGKIFDNGDILPLKNLDLLPMADFIDFDFNRYKCPDNLKILFSRGCTEHCVYCSARCVWKGFRTMSGVRIFNEIIYQVEDYLRRMGQERNVHIMFLDSLVNGNMNVFEEWIGKLAEARKDKNSILKNFGWSAQVIIRQEMTLEITKLAKEAGCVELNYGIESGSERVLKEMRKRYTPEIAERVIQNIYNAGIAAKGNFMFGFPTETEEDFQETMEFLRRNGKYMQQVYPSRTFCALERFSYLDENRNEFGVFVPHDGGDNLFWESQKGANNYLVRLNRYERFCELAASFSHKPLVTGVEDIKRDKLLCIGNYFLFREDYKKAKDFFEEYLRTGGIDKSVEGYLKLCNEKNKSRANSQTPETSNNDLEAKLRLQRENEELNEYEYNTRKAILASTPPNIFLQIDGPCNSQCIFCSRPDRYDFFSLDDYKKKLGEKFSPIIAKAKRLHLTGAGELLLLREAKEILTYFDNNFPYVEKIFATNGSTLNKELAELINRSESKYLLQISLHTCDSQIHKNLTKTDNFDIVMMNLQYLLEIRRKTGNPKVFLMFIVTSLNIKNLPEFIRFAAGLGVDRVICEYNSIYAPAQKQLSCYFKKDATNQILIEAEHIAKALGIAIDLPWKFDQEVYPALQICKEPWSQVMVNLRGEILPCCLFGDFHENLDKKNFMEIWNGKIYQDIRNRLTNEKGGYCEVCLRTKPSSVNELRAHTISRCNSEDTLKKLLEINL